MFLLLNKASNLSFTSCSNSIFCSLIFIKISPSLDFVVKGWCWVVSPFSHQVVFIEYLFVSIRFLFFNNRFNFHQSPHSSVQTQNITIIYESLVQILNICIIYLQLKYRFIIWYIYRSIVASKKASTITFIYASIFYLNYKF